MREGGSEGVTDIQIYRDTERRKTETDRETETERERRYSKTKIRENSEFQSI